MRLMLLTAAALAAGVSFAAMPAGAADSGTMLPNASKTPTTAPAMAETKVDTATFVKKVPSANEFEIQSSQMALQKASADDVKKFAQQMIDDHTKAGEQLAEAAKGQDLATALPTGVDAAHDQRLQDLANATEQDFDRLYMRTQVEAHTAALKLQQDYSSFGGNPALKAIATQLVPIIKRHLDQAQSILDRLSRA